MIVGDEKMGDTGNQNLCGIEEVGEENKGEIFRGDQYDTE